MRHYREVLDGAFPRSLQRKRNALSLRHLPYCYPTIKRKCFSAATWLVGGSLESFSSTSCGRTCTQVGHNCLRTIVSLYNLPSKLSYRRVGKCLDFLNREFRPSHDLHDLSKASFDIKERFNQLHKRPGTHPKHRICCGAPMRRPTILVADAGQAFEVLDPNITKDVLERLFTRAIMSSKHPDPTVTVHNGGKSNVTWGGYIRHSLKDHTAFFISTIRRCGLALLNCKLYAVGNRIVRQKQGRPIGGPKVATNMSITGCRSEWIMMCR